MITVLSPAKTLDFTEQSLTRKFSEPEFLDQSQQLVDKLAKMSKSRIGKLMNISDKLAQLNVERYRAWSRPFTTENAKQAILAFQGDVYQGFDCDHWKAAQFTFAQKHVRILSGLYGVLRPLDLIQPYRLEMGTKLKVGKAKDLYEFWGDEITHRINTDLAESRSKALVNLASNEYFQAIDASTVLAPIVTPVFKDEKQGKYKIISFFAKRARGMMANFIVENRVKNPAQLKDFAEAGYRYDDSLSNDRELVFLREEQ